MLPQGIYLFVSLFIYLVGVIYFIFPLTCPCLLSFISLLIVLNYFLLSSKVLSSKVLNVAVGGVNVRARRVIFDIFFNHSQDWFWL